MRTIREILGATVAGAMVLAVSSAGGHAVAGEASRQMQIIQQWRGHNSAREQRQRIVVRDAKGWDQLWKAMHGAIVPKPDVPEVDFQKQMVIGAFLGTRPTGGFSVRITRVTQNDKIVVCVAEQSPGPDDIVTMALTSPYHVVVVPRSDKTVEFVSDGNDQEPGRLRRPSRLPMPAPGRSDRSEPPPPRQR